MPNVPVFEQYTVEKLDYTCRFFDELASGEQITAIQATYPQISPTGPTVTASIISDQGTNDAVQVWVDNPTNGITYTIKVLVTTSGGKEPMQVFKVIVDDTIP